MSKAFLVSALIAYAEARFGQEQTPVQFITALSNFGNPGEAATLAGGVPGVLLAAANPCAKLELADKIVTTLGTDPAVISGAIQLVAAEQNFNPFVVSVPNICGDATLPATAELRGVIPLIDPAVVGSDLENANSAASVTTPFDATGKSVADVMIDQGFSNFTVNGAAANAGGNTGGNGNAAATSAAAVATTSAVVSCGGAVITTTVLADASATEAATTTAAVAATTTAADAAATSAAVNTGASGGATPGATTDLTGVDFGKCDPQMDFQFGRTGRKADEGTFLPIDALVGQGQQDALNPNIITNRICDQLTNVCEANQAAKDVCQQAKALVASLGTKDASTAAAFNQALGF